MIRAFVATIDLATEERTAIRALLADDEIELQRETPGLWHMFKGDKQATFKLLGTLANGNKVFAVVGPHQVGTYLANKLGARVDGLLSAWRKPGTVAMLGGVTRRQWLEAHGVTFMTINGEDYPIPVLVRAGVSVRAIATDYEPIDEPVDEAV